MKPLQPSISTFRKLIEGGYLYVDKTHYIYKLIHEPAGVYFLSRPRRFGKSLFISTLDEIFRGNKELFQNLWLYDSDYSWATHPVIRIDFGRNTIKNAAHLEAIIDYYIEGIAQTHGLTLRGFDYQTRFDNLIVQLAQTAPVVILIDEYDKPLIDNLDDIENAKEIRHVMRAFYTIIKALDQYIRFVFITGISKFSKVGVFSTMNNLTDLTMSPRFATMLGLTETELRENFQEHITAFAKREGISEDEFMMQTATWYDGFRFTLESQNVYNPYSVLNLFFHQTFSNYWFESGTPTFLIDLVTKNNYETELLDELEVEELAFSTFDLENLAIIPLLFQTGYLTIKDYYVDEFGPAYVLYYPNFEVKNAFLAYLLNAYNSVEVSLNGSHLRHLLHALHAKEIARFFTILQTFFANVDYKLYIKEEKYYQTIFYLIFLLIGLRVRAEVETNQGRIDAVIELSDHIFLFEFKLDGTKDEALDQIKKHVYAQKYRQHGKSITLVGANFDSKKRTVTDWVSEPDYI